MKSQTSSVPAGEFKAECLRLLDNVALSRQPLIITKRGKPVAKLVPIAQPPLLFGALSGTVVRQGDLLSPIAEPWDAER